MRRLRNVLFLMIVLSMVLTGCGISSKSGTLKVGVRDDIMNLGYLNATTGEYYGLEIDLAQRLAADLGYASVEFVAVDPDNRKQMLLDGNVDCLIASYSITDTRLENFDFSPSYYTDNSGIMVEKSSQFQGIEALVGKRIGTLDGANTGPILEQRMTALGLITANDFKGTSMDKLASYSELSQALEEGTVDAVCMDGSIAKAYMDDDRVILEDIISQEEYGVATQKGSKLSGLVAKSIEKMLDNGTIAGLIDKWN